MQSNEVVALFGMKSPPEGVDGLFTSYTVFNDGDLRNTLIG
jgi:hypothetical protein